MTLLFGWLALRDAPFAEVGRAIARANWLLLIGLSVPAYLVSVYFRALRWRHLTDPIQPIETGALFRAAAVGFMANNIFPLRMGEVVRCWYLKRETGASGTALFGTVIIERVIDTVCVVAIAFGVLAFWGARADDDDLIARGAVLLLPVAIAPVAFLSALRLAPDQVARLAAFVLRPFPERIGAGVARTLDRFQDGLGALSGGSHLFWIFVHSVVIWLFASTIPFLAAIRAVGVEPASASEALAQAWLVLAAVGVAVALPSAPGFFGPYHFACKLALERFGIPAETAVAVGTLAHAVFWVTLTGLGLLVLRLRRTSLGEIDDATAEP